MDELPEIVSAMRQIALALAVMDEPREVVSLTAEHIHQLLATDVVVIFAWDEDGQDLNTMYSTRATLSAGDVVRNSRAVASALEQRQPVVVNEWDRTLESYAVAAVPLIIAGERVGVLTVGRCEPNCPFTDAQLDLLATLASLGVAPMLQMTQLQNQVHSLELRTALLRGRARMDDLTLRLKANQLLDDGQDLQQSGTPRLTQRERDILPLVAQGRTNREIGGTLHLSPGSVRNLVARLLMKLGARDRTNAVVIALARGLL